jgi:hypothetical protein
VCSITAKVPTCLRTLVIEVLVDSTAKGSARNGRVYFEFVHGGAFSAKTYDLNRPSESINVFLTEATWTPSDSMVVEGEGSGLPEGDTLHRLTTPQGLFVAKDGRVEQPLDDGPRLFGGARTLDELESASRQASDGGPVLPQGEGGQNEP